LAVSQVLVQLRYNDPEPLRILGGKRVMIESPLIKEIVAENTQKARQVAERLRNIRAQKKLNALVKHAAQCPDLEAFRRRLS
jgi:hypothetical protein